MQAELALDVGVSRTGTCPMRNLARLAAAAAALVAATPVLAQSEVPSMAVSYVGLDLSNPEGRATFERRIARATKRVCAPQGGHELAAMIRERRCVAESRKRSGTEVAALFEKHGRVQVAQAGTPDAAAAR